VGTDARIVCRRANVFGKAFLGVLPTMLPLGLEVTQRNINRVDGGIAKMGGRADRGRNYQTPKDFSLVA
jgi:hypothetical protein